MNFWIFTVFGISFIFLMTTLGASLVYFFSKNKSGKLNALFLGFVGGVMVAASIWSLLLPAIDLSANLGGWKVLPLLIGFVLGGLFLIVLDKIIPEHQTNNNFEKQKEVEIKKTKKLFFAVTIHNIPEGLAVGFAFGAAALIGTKLAFLSALGLAIGIGIQNLPEGTAVALPIKNAIGSKHKAFLYGVLSGAVEPVFAVIGYFLASTIQFLQPWILSFAAGAMIYVVASDLIPQSVTYDNSTFGTWGFMIGFAIMMALDVALG
ncbi:MAG: ZIP family metal transporter [Clostridia bacterium]|nr:ZIP family metal transporter [Clostridia bacterium]